jgi:hypothetical protein
MKRPRFIWLFCGALRHRFRNYFLLFHIYGEYDGLCFYLVKHGRVRILRVADLAVADAFADFYFGRNNAERQVNIKPYSAFVTKILFAEKRRRILVKLLDGFVFRRI